MNTSVSSTIIDTINIHDLLTSILVANNLKGPTNSSSARPDSPLPAVYIILFPNKWETYLFTEIGPFKSAEIFKNQ